MSCTPDERTSELDFARSLTTRTSDECSGPLVSMDVTSRQVCELEEIFSSQLAVDVLWDGYQGSEAIGPLHFSICGAHWLDLVALVLLRSHQQQRQDWYWCANALVQTLCRSAGWDDKELNNMLVWQRYSNS